MAIWNNEQEALLSERLMAYSHSEAKATVSRLSEQVMANSHLKPGQAQAGVLLQPCRAGHG